MSRKIYPRSTLLKLNTIAVIWCPLPIHNPYSKLFCFFFWHRNFIWKPIFKIFAAHFTTNLCLNIGKKIFYLIIYKLTIFQENAFSEASFSTLGQIFLFTKKERKIERKTIYVWKLSYCPSLNKTCFFFYSLILFSHIAITMHARDTPILITKAVVNIYFHWERKKQR